MAAPEDLVQFCTATHPRLVGFLTLFCGDRLVAEEIAQDALERACARWSMVSRSPSPEAWVHRVAINLIRSRYRRSAAERRALARHGPDARHEPENADVLSVRRAVSDLPARQREAIL